MNGPEPGKLRGVGGKNRIAYNQKRQSLVLAARSSFEETGQVSASGAARRAGITRELLYYYFDRNTGLTDAVLESYVAEAAESLRQKNATFGRSSWLDAAQARSFVGSLVRTVRECLFTQDGTPQPAISSSSKTWSVMRYKAAVSRGLALQVTDDYHLAWYMARRGVEREVCLGMCELLLHGLMGIMRSDCYPGDDKATAVILALLGLPMD